MTLREQIIRFLTSVGNTLTHWNFPRLPEVERANGVPLDGCIAHIYGYALRDNPYRWVNVVEFDLARRWDAQWIERHKAPNVGALDQGDNDQRPTETKRARVVIESDFPVELIGSNYP